MQTIREFLVRAVADSMISYDDTWVHSDAARDAGDSWLAEHYVTERVRFDAKQQAYMDVAGALGFSLYEIRDEAANVFETVKNERAAREAEREAERAAFNEIFNALPFEAKLAMLLD